MDRVEPAAFLIRADEGGIHRGKYCNSLHFRPMQRAQIDALALAPEHISRAKQDRFGIGAYKKNLFHFSFLPLYWVQHNAFRPICQARHKSVFSVRRLFFIQISVGNAWNFLHEPRQIV